MALRFALLSWTGILALGALGCGAGGIAADSDESNDESGTTDSPGDGDGDGDGEPGDGDGEPGDGDGDGEPSSRSCIDDGALARTLAIVDNDAMQVRLLGPGSERVLAAPLPPGSNTGGTITIDATEAHIAVASNVAGLEGGAMLRLFDREDGELLWALEFDDRRLGQLHLDDQGRIVAAYAWSPAPHAAGVLIVDGEASDMPTFSPVGPIGAEGWVPGWIFNDLGEQLGSGFHRPLADELVWVTQGTTAPGWRVDGETIEYIDTNQAIPEFVIASPESSRRIALPAFAEVDNIYLESSAGDYRLIAANLGQDLPPALVRLHVPSEAQLELELEPPGELEPFDCYSPRTVVDVEGRILVELRDAGAAQMYAWDPEGGEWTALGAAMTEVDDIGIGARFGRIEVIGAYGAGMTFCPFAEWTEPPAEAIVGNSLQLARIDPPLELVISPPSFDGVVVDSSEQCASWLGDGERTIHDLVDGDAIVFPSAGWATWLE